MFPDLKDDLPPTWQWPGLWSVNLPVLALLWHALFAHSFHIWLSGYHLFATAGLVWTFAAAERWIYFFRLHQGPPSEILAGDVIEQRDRMVRLCLLIVAGLLLIALFGARTREVGGMLIWSSLGGVYLVATRLAPERAGEFLPREMALAAYLAGTSVLFIWANAAFPPMRLLLPALLFLLLLFYYFCLIGSWANPLLPPLPTGPMLEGSAGAIYRGVPLLLIVAALVFVLFNRDVGTNPLFLSIGVSATILLLLDFWQRFLSKAAARLLADTALLAPALPLAIGF